LIGAGRHAYHPPAAGVNLPARSRPGGTRELRKEAAMIEPPEVVTVESERVSCDGGGGALGHPLVYLNMGGKGLVECPYCDRRFVLAEGATVGGGH
jgi:uncharacterized Zn-finger protein